MSHGYRVGATNEEQLRSSEEQLAQRARHMGLPQGHSVRELVVFCVPQLDCAMEHAKFATSSASTGMVGTCLQTADTWRAASRPGALTRLSRSLAQDGHPGFEILGWIFFPVAAAGPRRVDSPGPVANQ